MPELLSEPLGPGHQHIERLKRAAVIGGVAARQHQMTDRRDVAPRPDLDHFKAVQVIVHDRKCRANQEGSDMTEAWSPELQKLGQKERDKLAEQARKQAEAEAAAEAASSKEE